MSSGRDAIRDEFQRELDKAWQRVTSHQNGPVGWLLDFIQQELDVLTPSEWMVIAYEVAAFGEEAHPDRYAMPTAGASGWSVQAIPQEAVHYTLPSRKEATQLQILIRGHLEHLWEHAAAPITFSDLTLVITAPGALHERRGSLLVVMKPKSKEFEYRVAILLAQYSGRVRQCKECQRIFLAVRSDQLFCTTRCQMRLATRKYRQANKRNTRKEHR